MKTIYEQLTLRIKQTIQKKNITDIDHIKENHKEFIKNSKSILKTQ